MDLDLKIRGGGGGGGLKKMVLGPPLGASVWSKKNEGGRDPRAPRLDPPLGK